MSEHAHEKQVFRSLNQGMDNGRDINQIDGKKKSFQSKYDQQIAEMRNKGKVGGQRKQGSFASGKSGKLNFNNNDLQNSGLAIENDRLQTTILLLNQKLNEHCDHEQQIDVLKEKNVQMEEQIENQNAALLNRDQTINQLKSKIRQQDEEIRKVNQAKEVHKHDNCDLNDKAQSLEEELYESKQITLDLLQQLKDLELKYNNMESELQFQLKLSQSKIAELHDLLTAQNRVYIGKKYDGIDTILARYINTYPEKNKMKIMFIRHSEGVYTFGKKKVFIKIEGGNKIQVRVGGGYMHIEDFIEQYTPGEVEKIERNGTSGVNGRFARKFQMQTIASRSNTAVEYSPIRVTQNASSRPLSPSPRRMLKTSYSLIGGRTNTLQNQSPRKSKKKVNRPYTQEREMLY